MKTIISFLAVLLLLSCNVQKQQINKMQVFAVRYPDAFKILANTLDPCFTGKAKSDTIIQYGKIDTVITYGNMPSFKLDTSKMSFGHIVYYSVDTVIKTIKIKIPITKTITDTIPDMRAIEACHATEKIEADSLRDNKVKLVTETKKANKYCLWFWLENGFFILIIIVVAVWKVYGLFNGTAEVKAGANILNYFKKK